MLSGDLQNHIVESENVTPEAARKRIERLKSPIHKLKGLFADGQSMIYHATSYKSDEYFAALGEAFKNAGKRYYSVLKSLQYHEGYLSKNEISNYSFSPVKHTRGHVSFDSILENLLKHGLVKTYNDDYYEINERVFDLTLPDFRKYKALEFSKNLLLNQFNKWARNLGLISFTKGALNSVIANFQFSYGGPTYINGLVQFKNGVPTPGFLVCDVLIGSEASIADVDFFIQKIQSIRSKNPNLRLFPVLIVDSVEVNALNQLKKVGVMVASVKELFGEGYVELLKNLINTITNAGVILRKEPDKYIDLMQKLTKLVDGKTNNLRGDLFELAVGYYYAPDCNFLEIGKRVSLSTEPNGKEIDVLAHFSKEVVLAECKGYNYAVDDNYVLDYLNVRIPYFRKWTQESRIKKDTKFEIWSTGGFTDKAKELLEKAKRSTKKYTIDYLGKDEILTRAKGMPTQKFLEILKDYYFKEIA